MKQDVRLEPGDLRIIRNFVKVKVADYADEWTNEQCVDELTNWLYDNTHGEGELKWTF